MPLRSILVALVLAGAPGAALAQAADEAGQAEASEDGQATEQPAGGDAAAAEPTADSVVMVVDEAPVTLGELIAIRQSLPEQYQQLPDEVLLEGLTRQLTDQQLLANAARADGLQNRQAYEIALKNQRRAVLADLYMAEELVRRIDEAAVEAAYRRLVTDAPAVEEARAAHILVPEKATAEEIKAKLDAGADFAALAAEYGTDGTAQRGGDLGWFTKDQMVPQFAEAAFAMQPGEISDPVQSPFGWHLIKMDGRREQPKPELDEVREAIVSRLTQEAEEAILSELRAAAKITVTEDIPASAIRRNGLIAE